MLAASIFLKLSREGKLGCAVWLVHLTGEEFPSDCMGARDLAQSLVEGTLKLHTLGGKIHDLSKVNVEGAYILDMMLTIASATAMSSRSHRDSAVNLHGWRIRHIWPT